MVEFRRRKDNGQAFPLRGHKSTSVNLEQVRDQKEAYKKQVAKKLEGTDNKLAITETGKIKKGMMPAIEDGGNKKREEEAKEVLKDEAHIVQDLHNLEKIKHPDKKAVKAIEADVKNLSIVHPELAERVLD